MKYRSQDAAPPVGAEVVVHDSDHMGDFTFLAKRVDYKGTPSVRHFQCKSSGACWRFVNSDGERIPPIDSMYWSYK